MNAPQSPQPRPAQVSPGRILAMGLVFIAAGIVPILFGVGVMAPPQGSSNDAPPWVAMCAGLMFVMAGLVVILDFWIADGVGPDGDFRPGTPMAIRVGNLVLGASLVGLMTAVFGWVAFGPGTRQFSSTVSLPAGGVGLVQRSAEWSGRLFFGAFTVLGVVMFVTSTVIGIKRLWRARAK